MFWKRCKPKILLKEGDLLLLFCDVESGKVSVEDADEALSYYFTQHWKQCLYRWLEVVFGK